MKRRQRSKLVLKIVEEVRKSAEDFHNTPMAKQAFDQVKRFDEERRKVVDQYKEMTKPWPLFEGRMSILPPTKPLSIQDVRSLLADHRKDYTPKEKAVALHTELVYDKKKISLKN